MFIDPDGLFRNENMLSIVLRGFAWGAGTSIASGEAYRCEAGSDIAKGSSAFILADFVRGALDIAAAGV
jgi:hypothetical protein